MLQLQSQDIIAMSRQDAQGIWQKPQEVPGRPLESMTTHTVDPSKSHGLGCSSEHDSLDETGVDMEFVNLIQRMMISHIVESGTCMSRCHARPLSD